jgi:hypothetical protein
LYRSDAGAVQGELPPGCSPLGPGSHAERNGTSDRDAHDFGCLAGITLSQQTTNGGTSYEAQCSTANCSGTFQPRIALSTACNARTELHPGNAAEHRPRGQIGPGQHVGVSWVATGYRYDSQPGGSACNRTDRGSDQDPLIGWAGLHSRG